MLRNFALALLAVLAAGAFAAGAFVAAHTSDATGVDDADLAQERPPVPAQANGFPLLEAGAERLEWPEDADDRLREMRDERRVDTEYAQGLIARNGAALDALSAALAAGGFESPPMHTVQDDLPNMLRWTHIALLSALRGAVRADSGDARGALDDALAAVRLGQLVQSDRSAVLVHAMIGVGMKRTGVHWLALVMPRTRPDAATSRAFARDLLALRTDPDVQRAMWAGEYRVMRASFPDEQILEGEGARELLIQIAEKWEIPEARWPARLLPVSYVYQPEATAAAYAARIRAFRALAARPCRDLHVDPPPTKVERWRIALGPNGAGRLALLSDSLSFFELRRCEADTELAAAAASLALRAFELEHGVLPATLDALVPDYLDRVPEDAFDGAPLRWNAGRRLLFSVGSELDIRAPAYLQGAGERFRKPEFPLPF